MNARDRNRAHEAGRLPRHIVLQKIIDILKLLLAFLLWSHLCACLYWLVGRIQPIGYGQVPWVVKLLEDQPELREQDTWVFYVISLYWAVATALTIGYGDLTPNTPMEKVCVTLVMLFSSVLYASIFGQVTALVDSLDQINRRYQTELQRFTEFATIYKLPRSLRCRMCAHVHYVWQVTLVSWSYARPYHEEQRPNDTCTHA